MSLVGPSSPTIVLVKNSPYIKGKVRMPNKPIKAGFKVRCCCCSCCGYLCIFHVYEGKPIDPATGKSTSEKGMVTRVVKDLVGPFSSFSHVGLKLSKGNYACERIGDMCYYVFEDRSRVWSSLKQWRPRFFESSLTELCNFSLFPLSQVRKTMVLIEN